MNYYEIVYIIHPALQAGHLDDIINQINKKIEQTKGEILFFDNWGKKKLSYLIQKQKYGTYVMMQCNLNGNSVKELSSEFEHNTNILRHLISKITENEILEQKEQIQGSSNTKIDKNDESISSKSSNSKVTEDTNQETKEEDEKINDNGE